ncbi:TetR/AcrR family transcriptional regulator [Streptomyces sp. NPDC047829]|uniref:TetR/AcrR family transcriptional regulator n=1 Tax=Streptomyces sp. NPDC047829 TaxID=3154609 RepID=UPI0034034360
MDRVRRVGRPRDGERGEAILDATREILIRDGYAGLSMEKVAAAAGVGKPTLYRRWSSRSALVGDAVLRSFHAAVPGFEAGTGPDGATGRLAAWCGAYAAAARNATHASMVLALTAAAAESPHDADTFYRHHTRAQHQVLVDCLKAGVESGEVRGDADLEAVADALIGSVLYQLLTRTTEEAPVRMEHLVGLLLEGLRP